MSDFFKKFKINQQGQSLVELIVAVAVINIGLFSVWSLFLVNFNAEKEAEMRIVGANLSREGIELVKNIRDSNWLKMVVSESATKWDDDLNAGDYSINFGDGALSGIESSQLFFDSDGFYSNIAQGNKLSPYKRVITIKNICCQDNNPSDFKCDDTDFIISENDCASGNLKIGLDVIAKTTWQYSGSPRQAVVEDTIYNWR